MHFDEFSVVRVRVRKWNRGCQGLGEGSGLVGGRALEVHAGFGRPGTPCADSTGTVASRNLKVVGVWGWR